MRAFLTIAIGIGLSASACSEVDPPEAPALKSQQASAEGVVETDDTVKTKEVSRDDADAVPDCVLTADQANVEKESSVRISWQFTGQADSFSIDGIPVDLANSEMNVVVSDPKVFVGKVSNARGSSTCSTVVNINSASESLSCKVTASPSTIVAGEKTTLSLEIEGEGLTKILIDNEEYAPVTRTLEKTLTNSDTIRVAVYAGENLVFCSVDVKVTEPVTAPAPTPTAPTPTAPTPTAPTPLPTPVTPTPSPTVPTPTPTPTPTAPAPTTPTAPTPTTPTETPPSCTLSANRTSLTVGLNVSISLTSAGSVSSAKLGGFTISGTSGTLVFNPTSTTTYVGTVVSSSGASATCSVTIKVLPTCTLIATPSTVTAGQSTTLVLTVKGGATSAIVDGVAVSSAGASVIRTPTASKTYTASATSAFGTGSCFATVTVNDAVPSNAHRYYRVAVYSIAGSKTPFAAITKIQLRLGTSWATTNTGSSNKIAIGNSTVFLSASSYYLDDSTKYGAWQAFDDLNEKMWVSSLNSFSTTAPYNGYEWIQMYFDSEVEITGYRFSGYYINNDFCPDQALIEWSDDGVKFKQIPASQINTSTCPATVERTW